MTGSEDDTSNHASRKSDSIGSQKAQPRPNRTSCDMCKRMKIKCEWRGESCINCVSRGVKCDITVVERKKRAKKTPDSLQDFKNRIERLEAMLTASGIDPNKVTDAVDLPRRQENDLPKDLADRLSTLVISEKGTARFLGASSGFSLFSPQGLQWISERTGSNELSEFISGLAKKNESPWSVKTTDLWHTLSPLEREPLPPKELADVLVDYFFQTFNSVLPLFDRPTFDYYYNLQYAQQPIEGNAWYACLNIAICMGSLIWRVHDHEHQETLKVELQGFDEEQSFKYFRNACSCLTDLMFKDCSLMAVQAIVGIALVQQATLDPQPFYVLTAAAARLAHSIGIHRKLDHFGLSQAEVDQRRNVFWIVYFMDKSIALRVGHPSVMVDDDIGVDLPREKRTRETTALGAKWFETFRSQVELAMLESRIYTELYSVRARNRSHLERLKSVGTLDTALLEWRDKLPVEIRPGEPILCSKEQKIPVIMLQFAYFNCITTIHQMSNWGSWTGQRAREDWLSVNGEHLNPRVYSSHSICLSAARASIGLLNTDDVRTGSSRDHLVWMALYYPLSGSLILFANLLRNPADPNVESDLGLMELARSFVSPRSIGSTPFSANVPFRIFSELFNVARKFVDKVSSQGMHKAKRVNRGEDGRGDRQPASLHSNDAMAKNAPPNTAEDPLTTTSSIGDQNPPSPYAAFVPSNIATRPSAFPPQFSAIATSIFQPQSESRFPSDSTEIMGPTSYDGSMLGAEITSAGLIESMGMIGAQGQEPGGPTFTDSFEWDLANLWSSEFLVQDFEGPGGV